MKWNPKNAGKKVDEKEKIRKMLGEMIKRDAPHAIMCDVVNPKK